MEGSLIHKKIEHSKADISHHGHINRAKIISLKGVLADMDVEDSDIEEAKSSLRKK